VLPCLSKSLIRKLLEVHPRISSVALLADFSDERSQKLSDPIFMPKPSTHRMHDPGSIVLHIQPKVFTDN
jgi:hypothetical protein